MKLPLLCFAGLWVAAFDLLAQVPDLRPVPEPSVAPVPATRYTLQLQWNESRRELVLPYKNTSDKVLRIEAVQSSGGIFIVDFPKTIAPEKTGDISILFDSKSGTNSDSDVVRLKTSDGEKVLLVSHDRPTVARFDVPNLTWTVGEAATPKTAVLILTNDVKVEKVKAMLGHAASVEALGGGQFRLTVTPKSTAKAGSFPVIVSLTPDIPGVTPVLTCYIGTRD